MRANVLILSTALSGGGAEYVARQMAEHFDGCRCIVFQNRDHVQPTKYRLQTIPFAGFRNLLARSGINLFRLCFIQWVKFRYKPSITISHLEGPNFANLITIGSDKRIVFVHNCVNNNYSKGGLVENLKKFLVRYLYPKADRLVGVSLSVCEEMVNHYGVRQENVRFLPNPINNAQIRKLSTESFGDWRDRIIEMKYVINVASLIEQKNHQLLIRIYEHMRRIHSDLKLVLLGTGDKETSVRQLCADLRLSVNDRCAAVPDMSADVFFLGYQKNPYPFVAHSQLFLLPSLWEGMPIALLEAMSLGRPSIVSDCSPAIMEILDAKLPINALDNREVLGHERTRCGYLMYRFSPTNDKSVVANWVEVVSLILGDDAYKLSCGKDAASKADDHDVNKIRVCWEQLVRELTGNEKVF